MKPNYLNYFKIILKKLVDPKDKQKRKKRKENQITRYRNYKGVWQLILRKNLLPKKPWDDQDSRPNSAKCTKRGGTNPTELFQK